MGHLGHMGRSANSRLRPTTLQARPTSIWCTSVGSTTISVQAPHGILLLTPRALKQAQENCQIFVATSTFWSITSLLVGNVNSQRPRQSVTERWHSEWVKNVQLALNSKQRMKAACELTDAEKPQPCIAVDKAKFQAVYEPIMNVNRAIPEDVALLATSLISGSRLLDDIDISKAQVLDLRTINMMASCFHSLKSVGSLCLNRSKGNDSRRGPWSTAPQPKVLKTFCWKDSFVRPTGFTIQIIADATSPHLGGIILALRLAVRTASLSGLHRTWGIDPKNGAKDNNKCSSEPYIGELKVTSASKLEVMKGLSWTSHTVGSSQR